MLYLCSKKYIVAASAQHEFINQALAQNSDQKKSISPVENIWRQIQKRRISFEMRRFVLKLESVDSDYPDQRSDIASMTHSAVMLTIRRTVADAVRMCTGLAQPNRIGPIATPLPEAVFNRL